MQIITADEVASLLRVSRRHVFELAQPRTRCGDVRESPLPCIKLGKSVRFDKEAVEDWVKKQVVGNWVKHNATKKSE